MQDNPESSFKKQTANRRPNKPSDLSDFVFGKLPPQALPLEEAVLGALMLDKDAMSIVIEILKADSFYSDAHQLIFKAMLRLFERMQPIDLLTMVEELKKMAELDRVGGAHYLLELTNRVTSSANLEYHARILAQKYIQRELIRVSTAIIRDSYEDTTDVFDLLDKAEQGLFGIAEQNMNRGYEGMTTLAAKALKQIESLIGKEGGLTGIPSGFTNLDKVTSGWQRSDLIIMAARPGMGKCLGIGTKVLLFNGCLETVENIKTGDLLMGVDSKPRKVLGIGRGREQMYWVRQNKGIDYRVNESHILSLRRSRNEGRHKKGTVLNIALTDFLNTSNKFKTNYKGYKVAVDFAEQPVKIDPYFLGLWLGDGNSREIGITAIQPDVVEAIKQTANDYGLHIRHTIRTQGSSETYHLAAGRWNENTLRKAFIDYGLFQNKHIPQAYLANTKDIRLAVLAGLMDSDGHFQAKGNCFEIVQKKEELVRQIKRLCDTLGFRTTLKQKKASIKARNFESTVFRLRIYGDLETIPVRVAHKKPMPRRARVDWRVTGITIEPDKIDDYYGFELDQDGLFLLEDGTVTHNTSMTLAIARNAAADYNKGVAFFSLEMSKVQLVQRLISLEAEISGDKLRSGNIDNDELVRLHRAVEKLSEVPIFIDDTPGLNIFELRAKCRRLKMQHDIELIVIDYLQLMSGGGGSDKSGNREQEISAISRALKHLAKELNVPVIALSQLSRAVETRGGNKRPQLSDLRECVTGDTLIALADGSRRRIADCVGEQLEVVSIDTHTQKLVTQITDLIWEVGVKPVFELTLASGRKLKATAEHRLLTIDGWKIIGNMQEGQRIAIPRLFPEPTNPTNMSDDQLLLLGHLVGDGSYLSGQPLRYTTASEANSEAVTAAAKREFDMIVNRHEAPKEMNWHQLVFSGNGNRWQPKGMNKWLRDLGIFNQRSCEKQLPPIVFNLPNSKTALLLQHLWATDGTLFTPTTPNSSTRIAFSTNSWNLANDVAYLLLRFGIVARIRTTKQGENKEGKQYRDMYSVEVSGGDNQLHFLYSIGAFGDKKAQAKALYEYITTKKANTNIDTVPIEIFGYIKDKMQERGISQRQMAAKRGTSYGGSGHFSYAPSRKVLQSYADLLEDEYLENTSNSAIFWDTIKTIEPIGEEMVYDLTVPNYASWVANGIFSHNSGAIEQDADIVSFIYRPEYYKIDEDEEGNSTKGIGEIIIAKHRNGALEDVKLRFKAEFAKFENLDEAEYGFSVFDTFNPIEPPVSNIITRGSKLNNTPPPPAFGEDEVPF